MGGGVNPIEWVVPPLALTHLAVDQGSRMGASAVGANPDDIPAVPGSQAAKAKSNADTAEATRIKNQNLALDAQSKAEQDLNARTETPQEALDARRRAQAASTALAGGQRRASQTLTTPGMSLSGSY